MVAAAWLYGGTVNVTGATSGTSIAAGTTLSASGQTLGGVGKLVNLGTFNLANSTVTGNIDNQGTLSASGTSVVNGTQFVLTSGTLDLAAGGTLTKNGGSVEDRRGSERHWRVDDGGGRR